MKMVDKSDFVVSKEQLEVIYYLMNQKKESLNSIEVNQQSKVYLLE